MPPTPPPKRPSGAAGRSTALKRGAGGRLVSAKSRTGNPKCSAAMATISLARHGKPGPMALPDAHKQAGICRSEAHHLRASEGHRGAEREGKAQHLAHRVKQAQAGKAPITAKDRTARVKELVKTRAAKNAERDARKASTSATASGSADEPRRPRKLTTAEAMDWTPKATDPPAVGSGKPAAAEPPSKRVIKLARATPARQAVRQAEDRASAAVGRVVNLVEKHRAHKGDVHQVDELNHAIRHARDQLDMAARARTAVHGKHKTPRYHEEAEDKLSEYAKLVEDRGHSSVRGTPRGFDIERALDPSKVDALDLSGVGRVKALATRTDKPQYSPKQAVRVIARKFGPETRVAMDEANRRSVQFSRDRRVAKLPTEGTVKEVTDAAKQAYGKDFGKVVRSVYGGRNSKTAQIEVKKIRNGQNGREMAGAIGYREAEPVYVHRGAVPVNPANAGKLRGWTPKPKTPAAPSFSLKSAPAVSAPSFKVENLGRGKTGALFDMKRGDIKGQTSLMEVVGTTHTSHTPKATDRGTLARQQEAATLRAARRKVAINPERGDPIERIKRLAEKGAKTWQRANREGKTLGYEKRQRLFRTGAKAEDKANRIRKKLTGPKFSIRQYKQQRAAQSAYDRNLKPDGRGGFYGGD